MNATQTAYWVHDDDDEDDDDEDDEDGLLRKFS